MQFSAPGVFLAVLLAPLVSWGAPASYTFGGFSPGEREYWKRGADDQLCEPPATCRVVDKKDVKGFLKPARSRRVAATPLNVTIDGDVRVRLAAGDRDLGVFTAAGRVTAVNSNLFVSPGEALVAVEYEVVDKGGKRADVVVFALDAASPAPATQRALPQTALPSPSPGGPSTGKNAYDRALLHGGVWEQRLAACDQAGVTLNLKKANRKFDIKITTKCQGQKDVTQLDGTWSTEGQDTMVLTFTNEEGPAESMVCRFAACAEAPEDCLSCGHDDVTFTLRVVRR